MELPAIAWPGRYELTFLLATSLQATLVWVQFLISPSLTMVPLVEVAAFISPLVTSCQLHQTSASVQILNTATRLAAVFSSELGFFMLSVEKVPAAPHLRNLFLGSLLPSYCSASIMSFFLQLEGASVILTTLDYIPGKEIIEHYGLINGSTVRSKHLGRDMFAGIKNIFGGELKGYTELMEETRDEALERIVKMAESKGANAILNIRFGTSDVAPGAAEIFVYGTAVRI